MARSRFIFSVFVSALVLFQAVTLAPVRAKGSGDFGPLPVAISAEFDHPSQVGMYRTVVSSVVPILFATDQTGVMTARFGMEPADCFGLASWIPTGNVSEAIGPAVICVANGIVSEQEFNDWVDRSGHGKVDPGFVIPLGPPQPVEPIQAGQVPAQTRLNANRVIAQTFVNGCASGSFRKYGDLIFEKGTLAFTFSTDIRGRPQVDVAASLATVQNLNRDTWDLVREGCDAKQALPPTPTDGNGASFAGSSATPSLDPSSLSGQIDLIAGKIESLMFQQLLEAKDGQSLLRQLGDTVTSLQRTHVDQAAREIQKFRDSVATLGKRGLIDQAAAAGLAKGALEIETFLTGRVNLALPPPDPVLYCSGNGAPCPDTLKSCDFTSWHVDGVSRDPAPDGSPKHPFATITGALAQAATTKLCGVTLNVAPARYAGPLEITRHTRIIGPSSPISTDTFPSTIIEGSVNNHGPYLLEIANITLSWFRPEVANGVLVDHACAMTRLDHVAVLGYRGFGVRQRGGSLLAQETIVANTRSHPDSLVQGTGMFMNCGAKARLSDVALDSNESAALFLAGLGTEVQAIGLTVLNTRVHPSLAGAAPGAAVNWAGAVHIRDQADLEATSFYIAENWFASVFVDTGAVAVLDEGTISHTRLAVLSPPIADGDGGMNATAYRRGHLTMHNVISTRAERCGVYVAPGGELDLSGTTTLIRIDPPNPLFPHLGLGGVPVYEFASQVTRSAIGACVQVPGYRLSRLNASTVFLDNDRTIEAAAFPHPDVTDDAGGL